MGLRRFSMDNHVAQRSRTQVCSRRFNFVCKRYCHSSKPKIKHTKTKYIDESLALAVTACEFLIGAIKDTELKTFHIQNTAEKYIQETMASNSFVTCITEEGRDGVKHYLANDLEGMQKVFTQYIADSATKNLALK